MYVEPIASVTTAVALGLNFVATTFSWRHEVVLGGFGISKDSDLDGGLLCTFAG